MKKYLTFFSGSGCTGKTSVLDILKNELDPDLDSYLFSITRNFYKNNNIKNELEFSKLSDIEKLNFQLSLVDFYIEQFNESTKEDKNYFVDRSLIDYIAYTIYSGKNILNKDQYDILRKKMFNFFNELNNRFFIVIYYFPFPTPWSLDNGSSDGFRDDDFSKNVIIDSLIYKLAVSLCFNRKIKIDIISVPITDENMELLTPEQRYEFINDISNQLELTPFKENSENILFTDDNEYPANKHTLH